MLTVDTARNMNDRAVRHQGDVVLRCACGAVVRRVARGTRLDTAETVVCDRCAAGAGVRRG